MTIQPLDDRVLIELQEEAEERVGSIIVPDSAKEKPRIGTVIAVGTDEELQELVKEGNRVLYSKYSGDEITLDDKEYIIIQRSDILGILK